MSNEPIADESIDRRATGVETHVCANCGARVDGTEQHPVSAVMTGGDAVVLYLFCSAGCKASWQAETGR